MSSTEISIGSEAPSFTLPSSLNRPVALSEYLGRRVVLYFYPKDDTPGCTREACDFQSSQSQFTKAGVAVFGVSGDSVASHERFAKKFGLSFPLLTDADLAVSKSYGVYKKRALYGKTYWGIERTTFVIDESGKIAAIFPKVKVDGHVLEVLGLLNSSKTARS